MTLQTQLFNEEIHDVNQACFTDPVSQPIRENTDWLRSMPSMKPAMPASAGPADLYHREQFPLSLRQFCHPGSPCGSHPEDQFRQDRFP